ncbi:MAG: PQQ-binding-like beta-propeller repeat protein [Gemmatimonadaceae bacterium]
MQISYRTCRSYGTHLLSGVLIACSSPGDPSSSGVNRDEWSTPAPRLWGTPAVDDARIYVGTMGGQLVAIDRRSHRIAWTATTAQGTFRTALAGVVLSDSIVVVADGELFAYRTTTGAALWAYYPDDLGAAGVFGIASDGRTIYTGSNNGSVYAVDIHTGAEVWKTVIEKRVEGVSVFGPVVTDAAIITGYKVFTNPTTGGVVALDRATGALRWRRTFDPDVPGHPSGVSTVPAAAGNTVIIPNDDGRVFALSAQDGAVLWIAPRLPELQGTTDLRYPATSGGMALVGSLAGAVSAYDQVSGALRWKRQLFLGAIAFPLVADSGSVYVESLNGQLLSIRLSDGEVNYVLGMLPNGQEGPYNPNPIVVADTLFVPGVAAMYKVLKRR